MTFAFILYISAHRCTSPQFTGTPKLSPAAAQRSVVTVLASAGCCVPYLNIRHRDWAEIITVLFCILWYPSSLKITGFFFPPGYVVCWASHEISDEIDSSTVSTNEVHLNTDVKNSIFYLLNYEPKRCSKIILCLQPPIFQISGLQTFQLKCTPWKNFEILYPVWNLFFLKILT